MDIQVKWFYRLGFLLLLFIVVFIFFKLSPVWVPILNVLLALLIPFIIAAFITYLLHPIVERLHDTGMHRGVAVAIIYLLFFGGIGFALYKAIPAFIDQLRDLSENAPVFAEQYRGWLHTVQEQTSRWPHGMQERVESGIAAGERMLDGLLEKIVNTLLNIINSFVIIAIIPFIAFYMLKDFQKMKKAVWYLTPRKWRMEGIQFLKDVDKSLGSYIRGQLLVCVVIGSLSAFLFWFAGIPYSLLLGFIVGVTNVIPYFGPIIGAVPAVIIAATTSPKMIIITIVIIFVLQFIEGNLLSPLIVGKSLHMHPLLIMLALLAGGEMGGIAELYKS